MCKRVSVAGRPAAPPRARHRPHPLPSWRARQLGQSSGAPAARSAVGVWGRGRSANWLPQTDNCKRIWNWGQQERSMRWLLTRDNPRQQSATSVIVLPWPHISRGWSCPRVCHPHSHVCDPGRVVGVCSGPPAAFPPGALLISAPWNCRFLPRRRRPFQDLDQPPSSKERGVHFTCTSAQGTSQGRLWGGRQGRGCRHHTGCTWLTAASAPGRGWLPRAPHPPRGSSGGGADPDSCRQMTGDGVPAKRHVAPRH